MTLHDSSVSLANSWRKVVISVHTWDKVLTTLLISLWYICLAWIISQNVFLFFFFFFFFLDKCNFNSKGKRQVSDNFKWLFWKSEKGARWMWVELCSIRWVDIRIGHCSERSLFQKTMFEFSNFRIMTFQNNECSKKKMTVGNNYFQNKRLWNNDPLE